MGREEKVKLLRKICSDYGLVVVSYLGTFSDDLYIANLENLIGKGEYIARITLNELDGMGEEDLEGVLLDATIRDSFG